jgi:hypothetical protein
MNPPDWSIWYAGHLLENGNEARSVVQEVRSSLEVTFHPWGETSTGKVNQKVVP